MIFFKPAIYPILLLGLSGQANAQESEDDKLQQLVQAKGCASCHGTKGQGNTFMKGPKLAGQSAEELIDKLKSYRNGTAKNPTMGVMAARLTDTEINMLAKYFSQFK